MKKLLLFLLSLPLLMATSPTGAAAATVHASVAASLGEAFKEIVSVFSITNDDVEVVANYGASGTLAKQILQGAPADLFISANRQWLDTLLEAGVADPATVALLATNRLVFVGAKGAAASLADLPRLQRIAIGSPSSVPAGQYAAEALHKAGLYEPLAVEGKLVQTKDVRQALVYADRGETDGAFVYRSDALLARSAVILFEVPGEMHAPIDYPVALTVSGAGNPAARAFLDYLLSSASRAILAKYGFIVR